MVQLNYLALLLLSAAAGLGLAVFAPRYRSVPAAMPFAVMAALSAGLALVCALDLSSTDLSAKILLARLRFLFVAPLPVAQLVLAARYTGLDRWLNRRVLGLLVIVPTVAVGLALFDGSGLFRYGYHLDLSGPLPLLRYGNGPLLHAYAAYNAGLILVFVGILARWVRSAPVLHARPTLLLAAGVALPSLSEGLFLLGFTPVAGYNLTPVLFVFSYVLFALAVFRDRLLDVSPIARVTVVEAMPDPALVLDGAGRISDLNLAARRALGLDPSRAIGSTISEALARWPDLIAAIAVDSGDGDSDGAAAERTSTVVGRVFAVSAAPISDKHGRLRGRLVTLRDVSAGHRAFAALESLRDSASALASTLDTEDLLDLILTSAGRVVPHDTATIVLLEDEGVARVVRSRGYAERGAETPRQFWQMPLSDMPTVRGIVESGEPLVIPDTLADPRWVRLPDSGWIASYAGIPIRLLGRIIGVINLDSATPGAFDPTQVSLLRVFADQVAAAIGNARLYADAQREIAERARAEESLRDANQRLQTQLAEIQALQAQLREQAIRDALTGLHNRRYCEAALVRELALASRVENATLAVVMADVDHFKGVNDTFGHAAGDAVLRSLGCLLKSRIRESDIVGRWGGEEFLLLLPGADATRLFERVDSLRREFAAQVVAHGGSTIQTTLSIGVAHYPANGASTTELLRAADAALYVAKLAGRNRTIVAPVGVVTIDEARD